MAVGVFPVVGIIQLGAGVSGSTGSGRWRRRRVGRRDLGRRHQQKLLAAAAQPDRTWLERRVNSPFIVALLLALRESPQGRALREGPVWSRHGRPKSLDRTLRSAARAYCKLGNWMRWLCLWMAES